MALIRSAPLRPRAAADPRRGQLAGARDARGRSRRAAVHAERRGRVDRGRRTGSRYIDWVLSWGPLLFGHADPATLAAVAEALARGHDVRRADRGRGRARRRDRRRGAVGRDGAPRLVRHRGAMSAVRLARAATRRDRLIKFAGYYHGHVDALLASAGSGLMTLGIPSTPGVPSGVTADTIVLPYNDVDAVAAAVARVRRRARRDPRRAGRREHGRRPACAGLPRGAAALCATRAARCSSSTR